MSGNKKFKYCELCYRFSVVKGNEIPYGLTTFHAKQSSTQISLYV